MAEGQGSAPRDEGGSGGLGGGSGSNGRDGVCSSLESYEVPHLKVRMGVKN